LEVAYLTFSDPKRLFSSGPYAFIFSCFVEYYFSVPATYRFSVKFLSNKIFTYLLGFQLLFANFPVSAVAATCGILSGLFYRSRLFNLSSLKFSRSISNFCEKYLLPFILSASPASTSISQSSSSSSSSGVGVGSQLYNSSSSFSLPQNFNNGNNNTSVSSFGMPSAPGQRVTPSEENIQQLISMGFDRSDARRALVSSGNNLEVATHLLLNNQG